MMLQAIDLHCVKDKRTIFAHINFELNAGQGLLLQGENGTGKSSLLHILASLAQPYRGDVTWNNQSIFHSETDYTTDLLFISHSNGLKLGLTVWENLTLLKQHYSDRPIADASIQIVLEKLKLDSHRNQICRQLSAGQKRRVALAKLFLVEKKLWICDEPLTSLDTDTQALFLSLLEAHLEKNGIAILSSHHAIPIKLAKTLRLSI